MLRAWSVFFTLHYLIPCAEAGLWEMEPSKFSLKLCSKSSEIMSNILGHTLFYRFVRTSQSILQCPQKFFSQNASKSACFPCLLPNFLLFLPFLWLFHWQWAHKHVYRKTWLSLRSFSCAVVSEWMKPMSPVLSQSREMPTFSIHFELSSERVDA